MLLQVHADAAEENLLLADVGLIREGGGVDGQQDDIVTLAFELGRERVIADTTAAVHLRGAGGDEPGSSYDRPR